MDLGRRRGTRHAAKAGAREHGPFDRFDPRELDGNALQTKLSLDGALKHLPGPRPFLAQDPHRGRQVLYGRFAAGQRMIGPGHDNQRIFPPWKGDQRRVFQYPFDPSGIAFKTQQ